MPERPPPRNGAVRVFALLGAFDDQHRRLSLTELARRCGLPLSTTHRLAAELTALGALTRSPSGRYTIGRRLWDLGLLAPEQTGLRAVASPYLHDVYASTLATVHLAVREHTEVLYLDRLSGVRSVPVVSSIGGRLPLHATGVGKVLLAHAPPEVLDQVLGRLERITPYTITQPGVLRRQLARIRRDGHATTTEEMSLGACSVAVPVLVEGPAGVEVTAALGIVVPHLGRGRAGYLSALQVAARAIGRALPPGRG